MENDDHFIFLSQLFLCHLKGLGLPYGATIHISVPSPTLSIVSMDEMHLIQP